VFVILSRPQTLEISMNLRQTASTLIAALTLAGLATPAHAALDTRLKAAAEQAQPAVIDSLRDMVMIESGSSDTAGLAKMAAFTEARLQAMGAKTERVKSPREGGGDIVIGRFEGTGKKRVMMMAHMDTVYQPGILTSQPYRVEGNRIYGPGIADDKGGIAVILHSLKILRDTGWRDFATLTVVFNADEEVGSRDSGELIATLAEQHDVVFSCEPTAAKAVAKTEALLLGAAGIASATLEVKGRTSHAGAAPELGRNALVELSHQITQTRDVAKDIPGVQLSWTLSKAGRVVNQIPESAEATGDVRITIPGAEAKLLTALQAKIAESRLVSDTLTSVKLVVGRPSFVANDKGRALAAQAQAIYAELDGRPLQLVPMTGGGTDAGYAGRSGKAAVVESFGLAGFGYHAKDEYIEVDSIVPRLYLMTRLLTEVGKQ
jgi:glutamate carboxypeptidase